MLSALMTPSIAGIPIADPLADFASRHGLKAIDQISKVEADITGDGRMDVLLCYVNPDPDIEDRRVAATGDQRLWWMPYVKNANGTYRLPTGVRENGEIIAVPTIAFDPQEVYLGQVTEINRFALTAREKQTPRKAEAISILWAFIWENGHFNRTKLGEYITGKQNPLFDKYLAATKRTVVKIQKVTP